jgi:flagellin
VQSASDNVGETERGFLDTEAQQLIQEADRIARSTRFGNKVLLDGTGGKLDFHVGPFAGAENIVSFSLDADATASKLGFDDIAIGDKDGARESLAKVDAALINMGKIRADFGAVQSRLQTTVSNLDIQNENLSAAKSRIADADVAQETADLASAQILQNAAVSVLAQANQFGAAALKLL